MSTQLGTIGETAVKLYFLRRGFEVYTGDDNTSCDFVSLNPKTGKMKRVEVKTTRRRNKNNSSWIVDIRRSYGGSDFSDNDVDLLAIYIEPVNEIRVFKAENIETRTLLTLSDNVGTL